MTTPVSIFTQNGVEITENARSVSYLMGISDFFHSVFEEKEVIETLLETQALSASEIYSNFLQLTSTISLETIQTFTGVSLTLVFLSSSNQVSPNQFKLDKQFVQCEFLANRPYMPTETLADGVDFIFERFEDHTLLTLARPIGEYQFSQRVNSSGQTEYAIWISNAIIDRELMQKYFGNLIAVDPEQSSEQLSNFIYGLYFLYANGPTISAIEKGANLTLGIPLCRSTEQVIDIRTYLDTDQYLVITDKNQYVLPEGIPTIVNIGDSLSAGDLLARVVEIRDYRRSGEWWINVAIPKHIIPEQPKSQKNRYAVAGSFFYDIMKTHLFRHTFLVRINITEFRNNDYFAKMLKIIDRAKPAYTQPIYTWRVILGEEDGAFALEEQAFSVDTSAGVPLQYINSNPINENAIG